jgi:hypothetical protein
MMISWLASCKSGCSPVENSIANANANANANAVLNSRLLILSMMVIPEPCLACLV